MSKADTSRVFKALEATARSGRSDLHRWLWDHRDDMRALLVERGPSWTVVARGLTAAGLLNARGVAPDARCVRRVWATVLRDEARVAAARAAVRAVAPPTPPARRKHPVAAPWGGGTPAPAPVPAPAAGAWPAPASPSPAGTGTGAATPAPQFTPEEQERIRVQTERVMAEFRKSDEKFRLG